MSPVIISQNFMLNDIFCLLIAIVTMPIFTLVPGYVVGWIGNVFAFRERRMILRLVMSVVLSIAVFPILVYLLARLTSFNIALYAYVVILLIFLWLILKERKKFLFFLDPWSRVAILLTFIWILLAIISLPDIQINQRLYPNVVSFDLQTRVALTDSIFRTGIPPVNPHTYPGKALHVSYFYFWNMFPALLSRLTLGLIDARIAFYSSIVWVGIALRAVACLYLRFQSPESKQEIGPRCVAAIGLFFITGLDIIFVLIRLFQSVESPTITEWWNGNSQVTAWTGASLWVPHHISALVVGITGILLFQGTTQNVSFKHKVLLSILTALSLASLVGLSVYLALVFAGFWVIYFICALCIKAWRSRVPWLITIGFLAGLLAFPFLIELFLSRTSFTTQSQGSFLGFEVRRLGLLDMYMVGKPNWQVNLFNFILLPANYFLELGFFLLAGLWYIQSAVRHRKPLWNYLPIDLILLSVSLFICSFFRSVIISNNDVGWRGFMPVQFILLVWGANFLVSNWKKPDNIFVTNQEKSSNLIRKILVVLLIIGLSSTLFDLAYLRTYLISKDDNAQLGKETNTSRNTWGVRLYAIREAYSFINNTYPNSIIVQNNPQYDVIFHSQGLYGMRQTVAAGENFRFIYGDSSDDFNEMVTKFLPVFLDGQLNWQSVKEICRTSQIDLLIIKDLDPVWEDENSWVWKHTPVFWNQYSRVFECNLNDY